MGGGEGGLKKVAVLASMVWFEYLVLLFPNTKKDSQSSCCCLFLAYFYLYLYILYFLGGGGGAAFENILKRIFGLWYCIVLIVLNDRHVVCMHGHITHMQISKRYYQHHNH